MSQFSVSKSNVGDMSIESGVVVDITPATTAVFNISPLTFEGVANDPTTMANRLVSRFSGGSSRNMVIETKIPNIPSGWFVQSEKYKWVSEDEDFMVEVADDGSLKWSDATDIIMTAPAGSIPLDDRITCGSLTTSGGVGNSEFIVDLGTATGLVTLNFDAYSIPDIFKVEYDGVEVINTGYRGDSGTYDGTVVVVAGPGNGSATFTKSTASPTTAIVRVIAPFTGTAWDLDLSCPGGGAAPYVPASPGRSTFTATSTAYGDSLNGGTAFTLGVTFEGGELATEIQITSEPLGSLITLPQESVTRWSNYDFRCDIDENGDGTISDHSDVIAIRPTVIGAELYLDPSGYYEATNYGRDTYNLGGEFFVSVLMAPTSPLGLYIYLKLNNSSGSITSVEGPFSAPTLPVNTSGVKIVPIAYSDGAGKIFQYYESAILWK